MTNTQPYPTKYCTMVKLLFYLKLSTTSSEYVTFFNIKFHNLTERSYGKLSIARKVVCDFDLEPITFKITSVSWRPCDELMTNCDKFH